MVKGKITEEEGRRIILRGHGGDRRSKAVVDQLGNDNGVTKLKPSEANTKAHILARLDQDHPGACCQGPRQNDVSERT